jgi:membrane-associated phospholipid phosphatase
MEGAGERRARGTAPRTGRSGVALVWWISIAWSVHVALAAIAAPLLYRALRPLTDPFDDRILRGVYLAYDARAAEVAEAISLFGQPWLAVPLAICAMGLLYVYATPRDALFLALVYVFAGAEYLAVLEIFARDRPHLFAELPAPTGFSTPSGHVISTTALFVPLAIVALRNLGRWGPLFAALGFLFVFLIGAARPYLQVHYPSDVLLAWIFCGTWIATVYAILYGTEVPYGLSGRASGDRGSSVSGSSEPGATRTMRSVGG